MDAFGISAANKPAVTILVNASHRERTIAEIGSDTADAQPSIIRAITAL